MAFEFPKAKSVRINEEDVDNFKVWENKLPRLIPTNDKNVFLIMNPNDAFMNYMKESFDYEVVEEFEQS